MILTLKLFFSQKGEIINKVLLLRIIFQLYLAINNGSMLVEYILEKVITDEKLSILG